MPNSSQPPRSGEYRRAGASKSLADVIASAPRRWSQPAVAAAIAMDMASGVDRTPEHWSRTLDRLDAFVAELAEASNH